MPKYRIESQLDIVLIVDAVNPATASKIVNDLRSEVVTVKFVARNPKVQIEGEAGSFTSFYNDAEPDEIEC